jgi:hypothetical protein
MDRGTIVSYTTDDPCEPDSPNHSEACCGIIISVYLDVISTAYVRWVQRCPKHLERSSMYESCFLRQLSQIGHM